MECSLTRRRRIVSARRYTEKTVQAQNGWSIPITCLPGRNLFVNGYRWYNPDWGRYTQSDPVPAKSARNRYRYAGTNPLRFVDPFGLQEYPMPGSDFGSGLWGTRPGPDDCCRSEIEAALESAYLQLDRMMWGMNPIGEAVAWDPDAWHLMDEAGWMYPQGPDLSEPWVPDFINPPKDPCVNFCAAVHEWYHHTDVRRWRLEWLDMTTPAGGSIANIFWERPAYRLGAQCLESFLSH
jgi:RHS repeat-associated protein